MVIKKDISYQLTSNLNICITGRICSGKSYINNILANQERASNQEHASKRKKEYVTLHADSIAKNIITDKLHIERNEYVEFMNMHPKILDSLSVCHQPTYNYIQQKMQENKDKILFVEAPLVFEHSKEGMFDIVINAYCSLETEMQRIKERNLTNNLYSKIISMQFSNAVRNNLAHYTINTNNNTLQQIEDILKDIDV